MRNRDTKPAIVCGLVALLFAVVLVCSAFVKGQEQRDYSGKSIVVFSPSYFECQHCESFHRHGQMLKRQYPGLVIHEFKLTEAEAKRLGIKGFPTIIVGQRLTGFGSDEREVIRGEISRW